MANKRFIYAAVAADDANVIPVSAILGMDVHSDAESIKIHHAGFDVQDNNGTIDLEVKAGSVKTVMKAIVNAINFSKDAFVVIGDDVNSVYVHTDLEDVTATVN